MCEDSLKSELAVDVMNLVMQVNNQCRWAVYVNNVDDITETAKFIGAVTEDTIPAYTINCGMVGSKYVVLNITMKYKDGQDGTHCLVELDNGVYSINYIGYSIFYALVKEATSNNRILRNLEDIYSIACYNSNELAFSLWSFIQAGLVPVYIPLQPAVRQVTRLSVASGDTIYYIVYDKRKKRFACKSMTIEDSYFDTKHGVPYLLSMSGKHISVFRFGKEYFTSIMMANKRCELMNKQYCSTEERE
jgi:hypothetical protein